MDDIYYASMFASVAAGWHSPLGFGNPSAVLRRNKRRFFYCGLKICHSCKNRYETHDVEKNVGNKARPYAFTLLCCKSNKQCYRQ